MGFEEACIAFYDNPGLVEEMIGIATNCVIKVAQPGLEQARWIE